MMTDTLELHFPDQGRGARENMIFNLGCFFMVGSASMGFVKRVTEHS